MPQTPTQEIRVVGRFENRITIAVVIPTYNEAENIGNIVQQLFDLKIDSLGVLFVDDSSPDGTGEIADGLANQHPDVSWSRIGAANWDWELLISPGSRWHWMPVLRTSFRWIATYRTLPPRSLK